jgi:hypothetical protein
MFEFEYNKPFAIINGVQYEVYEFMISAPNGFTMLFLNDVYNWGTTAVENQTTINGTLQTSAQMIFDTLSSDGQS